MLFSCIDDLMFTVLSSCGPLWYCLSNVVESWVFVVLASSGCHGARHCPALNASSPALDRLQPCPRPPAPPPTTSNPALDNHASLCAQHSQPCRQPPQPMMTSSTTSISPSLRSPQLWHLTQPWPTTWPNHCLYLCLWNFKIGIK